MSEGSNIDATADSQSASKLALPPTETQKKKQKPKKKKRKPLKFSSRTPLPFDLPYQTYYAKRIPVMQTFRSALLQHYARDTGRQNPLKRGLRRFGDLLTGGHTHVAAECGVFHGSCLIACAEIIRQYGLDAHIYGLDSFAGLPEFAQIDREMADDLILDILRDRGNVFDDTSLEQVQTSLNERDLSRYATLVPGFFAETLPTLPEGPYFFVNIDCDLYDGHLECLEFFYPRLESGGMVFFDDYYSVHFPMAKVAIDEFMKGRSESLFHIRYGPDDANMTKAFFIKH